MSDDRNSASERKASGLGWVAVPVLIFGGIAALFGLALTSGDPSKIPSTLIGRAVPATEFPALAEYNDGGKPVAGFGSADLASGQVSVVNFWASWCGPCVEEHPRLTKLKDKTGVEIFGVNYKDPPASARRFLERLGNPYVAIGTDPAGRGAIDWGVYGMPETFVIDGKGRVVYKHIGPITDRSLETQLLPAIKKAREAS